jgi:hypothetical protein
LVTTDRNLRYQQNLAGRKIALVVLGQAAGASSNGTSQKSLRQSTRPAQAAIPRFKSRSNKIPYRRKGR